MADVHTARLCIEIIHSHFGSITAKIASILLTRGRLPISNLIRYTSFKSRTVRAAILILVQHNILWHYRTEDEGEVFEVNTEECIMRLRFGKFVSRAEQLLGSVAAEIVQIILDHGKLRPSDILSHLAIYDSKAILLYNQTIFKLVQGMYLKPSTVLSHVSPCDKRIRYENEEKAKISGFPTAKQLREAKEVARTRLKREEVEAENVGLKRAIPDKPVLYKSNKKSKPVVEEVIINEAVYFKVNYEKFNVHIRNSLIASSAGERFNDGAAAVINATLKATEASQLTVADRRSDPISISSILMQLPDNEDLSKGLIHASKKINNPICVKDYLGLLSSADNPTPSGKASSFLSFGSSKVQVEFDIISRRLGRRVLEAVAREKHGDEGVRVIRLLLETGKMDEKQIAKVVMMTAKDVRPLLAALSTDSFISLQEVPKSADRNPTRTIYLWYVDLQKAYSVLLGSVYKTLYNISMRRRAEEEVNEVKVVLGKRERTDVRQDDNLLTRLERDIIQEWEKKRTKTTILEMRVEETVFVLKDLAVTRGDDL